MSTIAAISATRSRTQPTVLIAGAGIGGLALAIRLADLGFPSLVIEARTEASIVSEGVFLTLAPNGMNGLRPLGCHETGRKSGIETLGIEIFSATGKRLNLADQHDHEAVFGAPSLTIERGRLVALLLAEARTRGVTVRFDARINGVVNALESVGVALLSGETLTAGILVAADGMRSTVRSRAFPEFPKPRYTGLIGTGGLAEVAVAGTQGIMRMTFGNQAFFGYIKAAGRPVFWFNSYAAPEIETGPVTDPVAYARRIAALHVDDPLDNAKILNAVDTLPRHYPIYDVPDLPAWHRGRLVLLGDAAHAIGPHTGQGASMAIEDALVLAACLAAEPDFSSAFARYESLRRARVATVLNITRRLGSQKQATSRIGLFLRDLILPLVIPLEIKSARKLMTYRADLAPLSQPVA